MSDTPETATSDATESYDESVSDGARTPSDPHDVPLVVESNASNYGASALPTAARVLAGEDAPAD